MDPRKAQEIQRSFMQAMFKLEAEYVALMQKLGCKNVTLYRF